MEFETGGESRSFPRPHIKKGYYPAKLIAVRPSTDSDGKLREGKWGHQLIFDFVVYETDANTGAPLKPMKFREDDLSEPQDVVISKFVYYENFSKKTPGTFVSAFTPNSRITKLMKALGWEFVANSKINIDEFIGRWVELNIDDYEYVDKFTEKKTIISSINNIKPYKGPIVGSVPEPKTNKIIIPSGNSPKMTEMDKQAKKTELDKLLANKYISEAAYKRAIEDLEV